MIDKQYMAEVANKNDGVIINVICKQWNDNFIVNGYHIEDVLCLIKNAYGERAKEGITFTTLNYTLDDFLKGRTDDDYWFLAFDDDDLLYGTARLTILNGHGLICNFAVSPQSQGKHVGSQLLSAVCNFAKEKKLDFVLSSTAIKAVSSVRCHCNNGFQIVGISVGLNRTYSSYVFRNQLSQSFLWNSSLFIKTRFMISYLLYRICKKPDGNNTFLGDFLRKHNVNF